MRTLPTSSRRLLVLGVVATAALLGAAGCGGDGYKNPVIPPPPPPPQTMMVEVRDYSFEPRSVTIQPGDTVRWVMRGTAPGHTVTAEDGTFDSGLVFTQAGAVYEHRFGPETNGQTFQYRCTSHYVCCQMQGSVRVGESAPPPGPGY